MKQPNLFDDPDEAAPDTPGLKPRGSIGTGERGSIEDPPDQAARRFAVEPENDVVLEASAGTGKTRVLVDRYVRLIEKGVDPTNILAITFTRKAAAEMRERVLATIRRRVADGVIDAAAWRALRDRIADIQISTIDAFCFSLLREFPLEAGVEPGFDVADETEMGRFSHEAMDLALRAVRGLVAGDDALRLLFARVKLPVLVDAVAGLLDRRHIAVPAVASYVRRQAAGATAAEAASTFVAELRQLFARSPARAALMDQGPQDSAEFRWLRTDLDTLDAFRADDVPRVQQLRRRLQRYFLTTNGEPRKRLAARFKADQFATKAARKAHEEAVRDLAPAVLTELDHLEARVNAMLARGLLRLLQIAAAKYEALLEEHALLDFAGMLERSVQLLSAQEEFARSRLKLQARYHHVLVDEFQDTSRLQWRLIELLVDAWGEGEGVSDVPTSIFVVGDRKQSIYRFRHAEVTLFDEAVRKIGGLRPGRTVRQVITTSFRAVPELLAFVNALAQSIESGVPIPERFAYTERDRFPVPVVSAGALRDGEPVLGLIAEPSMAACASALAAEVASLIGQVTVRTREGAPRLARADDIAILFRARHGHQYFEDALESRGIRTYVYKGLGFFDAPEVQDLQALMRFLAQPDSNLRAAEFLRSRFVRLSDPALVRLAPAFSDALVGDLAPDDTASLASTDAALLQVARAGTGRWLALADRLPPSELVDIVLRESAYVYEMRGRRLDQARENVKKVRGLVRRVEGRGYATLGRIAQYFETLRAGDESNAILEASGSVHLMTMHAAKGLEFPIVFLVNLQMQGRGRGGGFSVIEQGPDGESEVAFASTEATRLEDQRDAEELRRVLYVAATRACDRLYLAAEIDARGQVRRGPRSLASLLDPTLMSTFARAAASPDLDRITWETPHGGFTFKVCRAIEAPGPLSLDVATDAADLDLAWLIPGRPAPLAATAVDPEASRLQRDESMLPAPAAVRPLAAPRSSHDRLLGTLVHRLFQRAPRPERAAAVAADLVRPEERVDVTDLPDLLRTAVDLYTRLRDRPDAQAMLASGQAHYEFPFSYAPADRPGEILRGIIDCLVVPPAGPPLVLEFKTGDPRPEHAVQLARYAAAIREILAVDRVETKILYA